MHDAIADLVRDGDTVAIEGFTHLISFAAGHEIIRQGRRDLTLARLTPDLIYDQMIAAGVARKLIFSWLGNPGVGGLGAIRRRIEPATSGGPGQPPSLEIEEVPARAHCRSCAADFTLLDAFLLCDCGSADVQLLAGRDLSVASVEVA